MCVCDNLRVKELVCERGVCGSWCVQSVRERDMRDEVACERVVCERIVCEVLCVKELCVCVKGCT